MTTPERYDAIIIGAGQAGKPLAGELARAGWRTALIERALIGGTCINYGCTPTKTMVASARVAYLARRGADYGVLTGPIAVDQAKVRARKRAIVERFREGGQRGLEKTENLTLLFGEAAFEAKDTLSVKMNDGGTRRLTAPKIFINTGCRPAKPKLPGLDTVPALDSTSVMELDAVPEHLLVLGGGYIGLEFGQMFRRFGARVTIVQRGRHLIHREDPDVADEVAKILREDGCDIRLDTEAIRVEAGAGGAVQLAVRGPAGEETLSGSHLLVAAGRAPNSEALNLAAAGVEADSRGYIRVNERLETKVPGVYALGDIHGGPAFTHVSYDDYRVIRDNLLLGKQRTTKGRLVPSVIYIDPQLGRVGMTETEARAAGKNIRVAKMPMEHVARALEMDETRGFMKAIVDAETQQILGYTALGVEGGELMSAVELAMMGRLPYPVLKDAIFAHPTIAESLNNLFALLD
jgi:pyruvate/2-oxoglutarate dehydrogenase complex dihydrolipoamide dehydrogenase (E3) component